jgi:hypothetical protein
VAKKDADALDAMFADKGALRRDARKATKDAGGSDELADFFGSLNDAELDTLATTYEELGRLGLKGKTDSGGTATFL